MTAPRLRRLPENAVAALIGAAAFAVFTTGTAVAVATSAVSITDASSGARAHVTNKQSLVTTERDPYSGVYGRVDANGRQLVATRASVPGKVVAQHVQGVANSEQTIAAATMIVPSSGVMVIRTVSGSVDLPQGQNVGAFVRYYSRGSSDPVEVQIPLTPQGVFGGNDHIVATLDVELYPAPASIVSVTFARNSGAGTATGSWTLLGEML